MWFHDCICTRVVDGDTIDLEIDLGFKLKYKCRIRLFGVDTPELNSASAETRELAQLAKKFMQENLEGKKCHIFTFKDNDKYGRYLAEVFLEENPNTLISINNLLLERNLADIYD